MIPDEILNLPVVELAARMDSGALTSLALTEGYLARIERRQDLNAFITVTTDRALAEAKQADAARAAGRRGVLLGMPYALKDLIDTAGIRTTWGTRALVNRVPTVDADVQMRLRAAGAVLLGKLSMTELANAFGNSLPSANHNGACRNPWNTAAWAGGSSSGSGAAVAAGLCAFALGSETWGSIDCPAAFCGVVGYRPTYDVVSRSGAMTIGYTLDKVGVFARDARDVAPVLDTIKQAELAPARAKPRIAVVEFKGKTGLGPAYMEAWTRAIATMRTFDATVEVITLDFEARRVGAILTILLAERDVALDAFIRAHSHELYDKEPWEAKEAGLAQLGLTAVDYVKAARLRAIVQREWLALFERFDVVVCSGRAEPPLLVDKKLSDDEYSLTLARVVTDGNLAGLPAITMLMGFTPERYPISMHAVASAYEDAQLFAFAEAFQQRTEFHRVRPT
jgi:aspartyl-tRNA(Asn)/glutamyl-tRNA(Gln) amidotransferase subunit A